MSQHINTQKGDPKVRIISALTIKIPDPIMLPETIIMVSNKFKLRFNSLIVGLWI